MISQYRYVQGREAEYRFGPFASAHHAEDPNSGSNPAAWDYLPLLVRLRCPHHFREHRPTSL